MNALERARAYLKKGPPFWFHSDYQDSNYLGKKDGGAGGDFDFRNRKMWYAKTTTLFVAMWNTGKVQLEEYNVSGAMVVKVLNDQAVAVKQREEEAAKKKNGPSQSQLEDDARKNLNIPDDSPEDLKELAMKGITPSMLTCSARWSTFGPRSGISNARRMLRAMRLNICTAEDIVEGRVQIGEYASAMPKKVKQVAKQTAPKREGQDLAKPSSGKASRHETAGGEKNRPPSEPVLVETYTYPESVWVVTTCKVCGKEVSDQFLECDCLSRRCPTHWHADAAARLRAMLDDEQACGLVYELEAAFRDLQRARSASEADTALAADSAPIQIWKHCIKCSYKFRVDGNRVQSGCACG